MIRKKKQSAIRVIDLTGPQGNAFFLLGQADAWLKQLGKNQAEREEILDDMQSGDYEHLIEVFDKQFGSFVILER